MYDPDLTAMLTVMDARRRPHFAAVADLRVEPVDARGRRLPLAELVGEVVTEFAPGS